MFKGTFRLICGVFFGVAVLILAYDNVSKYLNKKPIEVPRVVVPSRADEPKDGLPPSEEPKAEPTPSEEPKAEPTPSEEPKTEPTPSEEPKVETIPSEEPKVETPPSEEPKVEPTPSEEPKVETIPSEEPKVEPISSEEPKVEPVDVVSKTDEDDLTRKNIEELEKTLKKASESPEQFKLEVETDKALYYEGDSIRIKVRAEIDSDYNLYVFGVILENPSLELLFPNEYSKSNRVPGRKTIEIPDPSIPNFEFYVDEAYGRERLVVIATKKPFNFDSELERKEFEEWLKKIQNDGKPVADDFVQLKHIATRAVQQFGPNGWAIKTVEFDSAPRPTEASADSGVRE